MKHNLISEYKKATTMKSLNELAKFYRQRAPQQNEKYITKMIEELHQLNQKLLIVFPDLELRFPTDDNAAFWYAKGKLDKSKDVLGENQK